MKQFDSFERLSNNDNNHMPDDYYDHHRVNISSQRGNVPEYHEGESYQMDGVWVTQKTVWAEHTQNGNVI